MEALQCSALHITQSCSAVSTQSLVECLLCFHVHQEKARLYIYPAIKLGRLPLLYHHHFFTQWLPAAVKLLHLFRPFRASSRTSSRPFRALALLQRRLHHIPHNTQLPPDLGGGGTSPTLLTKRRFGNDAWTARHSLGRVKHGCIDRYRHTG
ncbi:hypothetical protein E2C01_055128 [Portunus trituberculatus]|uniref:Uncharacterized protein n=1 Tax=Portunus trituberculatus TaxID=210409 RepID=A0A5B7GUG6_PORTR|nr:hypothetical protein [Portunus trituberculatus]